MRLKTAALGMMLLLAACSCPDARAGSVNGTVKLGGIYKDETAGDLSVMPETFNIYDGFSISGVNLNGKMGRRSLFTLNLHEVNQESARGMFSFRVPSLLTLSLKYNRHRQLFDAAGQVESARKDMRGSFVLTPSRSWRISADLGDQRKTGNRVSYLPNSPSFLGLSYDNKLYTGRFEVAGNRKGRTVAAAYEFSDFEDDNLAVAKRTGGVFSLRLNGPCYLFPDLLSHFVRASYGKQKLPGAGTEYDLGTFQYLGVVKPADAWRVKYQFFATRVDDHATRLKTDNIRNNVDVVWYHHAGNLTAGYGYVTNDDDRTLTKYDVWRVGGSYDYNHQVKARVSYASNQKQDTEELTLLKDMDASRFRADLTFDPTTNLTFGAGYLDRERKFPLLDVSAKGTRYNAFTRLAFPGWGAVNVDYSYSDDQYVDRLTGFRADNSTVSGRVDFEHIKDLRLSFGATYLDIGKDLDIEKSILSFEGHYNVGKDYFVEAKYNVYNYDDYVLLDRYYTANVVWLNFGYRISVD